jgi:hypothetical protein
MCYAVYISTDSDADLSTRNSERVRFAKVDAAKADACASMLEFENKWYVGSKSQCSCTFRHIADVDMRFSEPEDWFPEEEDAIVATRELYSTLEWLLASGHKVDLVDGWMDSGPEGVKVLDVSFDEVSAKAFRLFEDYRFRLRKK